MTTRSSLIERGFVRPTKMGWWTGCLTLSLMAAGFFWLFSEPAASAKEGQSAALDSEVLSPADKAGIAEVLRLKSELGDQVWPDLSRVDIPLVLFNDRYEFLIGEVDPPSPWQVVHGDDFSGRPYHRRLGANFQAFAVPVGTRWAGSLGTLEQMSSKTPFRLSRELHAMLMLHEVFHAFQATLVPQRFARAMSVYRSENRYPYKDPGFSAAWNSEGGALADALTALETTTISDLVRKFLDTREARRSQINLDSELISFEYELEWLEGLAKYAEVRFYELAASRASESAYASYRSDHPLWPADLARLRRNLGGQGGDLRFYLSGVAQAMLLDRLRPGWKAKAFGEKSNLEDFLRGAVTPD